MINSILSRHPGENISPSRPLRRRLSRVATAAALVFMAAFTALHASIIVDLYFLNLTAETGGSIGGTPGGGYISNITYSISATADPGYHFTEWTINGTETNPASVINGTLTASISYVAHFEADPPPPPTPQPTYHFTAIKVGAGTVIGNSGDYKEGQAIGAQAFADAGSVFVGWFVDDVLVSTQGIYVYTMPASDTVLEGRFESNTPELTATVVVQQTAGGTVNDASGTYPAGVTLTLTAVPDPGYTFGGWLMFTGHGSPDQSLDNPLVVVTTNYVGKTLTLTPLFSPSEGPTPTTDSTPPTSTPAPPVPPAAKPDFEKSNPAININGKKKDDATFMTTGSTFRLKGLATNSVDKIRWRLADGATHTVKVKAGANWVITVGILQMGPNIVQIWGSNSQNGKESGAHKALIIRK